jgi:hypothetical protein
MEGISESDPLLLLDPEMQTLARAIQDQPVPDMGMQADRIWNLSLTHGVAPLLHNALRRAASPITASGAGDLHALRRANMVRGTLALRQRDEVLSILQREGIPVLTLKGAALANTWYGDMSLRPFIDIDLLVPREKVRHARELLLQAGYEEGPNPGADHHLPPLIRLDRPCFIELHYDLTRLAHCFQPSFDDLYSRSMTLPSARDVSVRTLSAEDTLIHLCLHALAHIDHDHGWQLRHLCDLSRHIDAFTIDWVSYRKRARSLGVEAGCAAVLALGHIVAGAKVADEYLDRVTGTELLVHAVPGPTQHRLLAAFLKAITRGHLGRAATMVLRSMVERSQVSEDDTTHIRPTRLLAIVANLARETIRHPGLMRQQLTIWLPWADKQSDREQLLVDLLPPR